MELNAIRAKQRFHYGYTHNKGDILRVGQPFAQRDLDSLVKGNYAEWIDEAAEAKSEAATKETASQNPLAKGSHAASVGQASDAPLSCDVLGCTSKAFATAAALNAHQAQKHAAL